MAARSKSTKNSRDKNGPPYFAAPQWTSSDNPEYERLYRIGTSFVGQGIERVKQIVKEKSCGDFEKERIEYLSLENYTTAGMGVARSVYYRELALSDGDFYQSLISLTPRHSTSHFISQGLRRDRFEWLVQDVFLSEMLERLCTDWDQVERVLIDVFWGALPKKFVEKTGVQCSAQALTAWQEAWTDMGWMHKPKGGTIARDAARLYASVKHIYTEDEILMSDSTTRMIARALDRADPQNKPHYRDKPFSSATMWELRCLNELMANVGFTLKLQPDIETKVVVGLARGLYKLVRAVANETTSEYPDSTSKKIVEYTTWYDSLDDTSSDREGVSSDFWRLVADILYHLPIVRGFADLHRIVGSTERVQDEPGWNGLTFAACRKQFERNKVRVQSG